MFGCRENVEFVENVTHTHFKCHSFWCITIWDKKKIEAYKLSNVGENELSSFGAPVLMLLRIKCDLAERGELSLLDFEQRHFQINRSLGPGVRSLNLELA